MPRLLAVSDLHIGYQENRAITESLHPTGADDWLIVAGDVAEKVEDVEWTLRLLSERFAKVIWVPGNHELWTHPSDPVTLRGLERYERLVEICRGLGVVTPEDEFVVWTGEGGPLTIVPMFLLYDYSFLAPGTTTKEESLKVSYDTGVVCSDERFLHPDPYATREDWCRARIAYTQERLDALGPDVRTLLINHWPVERHPNDILRYPQFAVWCGTSLSADWHTRYRADVVVYGHLHIPRRTWKDGTRFEEVSVGYPREWKMWGHGSWLRQVLPAPDGVEAPEGGTDVSFQRMWPKPEQAPKK
ncbi:metallophosphoesterase family protein [Kineosporia succinea]|uniref:3',5'-cyclic AMP phosphodiesterase CpdA n=1 Tax=Kineosporia succinea TaxID=84632 RepID=A0ABT9P7W1_9ACTN|nr:metallophosphoesterase [Kineosporia succinea]MDP9828791.1 3',5'-cyclic AMP phosphodiesterase CpdA [Kineosporia succinea]